MKQNINFILFGLLLLTIASIVGLTLYYRSTYHGLEAMYSDALSDVDRTYTELNRSLEQAREKEALLNKKEQILLDYISELNLSKERESSLEEHFSSLRGEKEDLEYQLNASEREATTWKTKYEEAKGDLDVCNVDYRVKVSELEQSQRSVSECRANAVLIYDKADDLRDSVNDLKRDVGVISAQSNLIEGNISQVSDTSLRFNLQNSIDEIQSRVSSSNGIIADLLDYISSVTSWASSIKS